MSPFRAMSAFSSIFFLKPRFKCCISKMSTIYALSSGQGKCGVAVIRVSGSDAALAVQRIGDMRLLPPPRQAMLRRFKDPESGEELDRGLLLWFPGPRSFSGEDSCEFQVHGGPAVIAAMLQALGSLEGYRPAEPGEFTRRAFHNGKLDLTEVEGLADLIHAETEAQRKQALLQADGSLAQLYGSWRESLIKCTSHLEAYIDFSEDQSLEPDLLEQVELVVLALAEDMKNHLSSARCGERLREGVRTAIVGEPNVGKSSLLNALSGRPAAIVSEIPGTTRDVVESYVSVGGYPVVISDTAGLRDQPSDKIEEEGMLRARREAAKADVVLLVVDAVCLVSSCLAGEFSVSATVDGSAPPLSAESYLRDLVDRLGLNELLLEPVPWEHEISHEEQDDDDDVFAIESKAVEKIDEEELERERQELELAAAKLEKLLVFDGKKLNGEPMEASDNFLRLKAALAGPDVDMGEENFGGGDGLQLRTDKLLVVVNKVDLVEDIPALDRVLQGTFLSLLPVSCRTQQGLPAFVSELTRLLQAMCGQPSRESPAPSQARHRHHVTACAARLERCALLLDADATLAAHELRSALGHMGSITGHVTTEHILDAIFRDFCIGK